MKTQKDYQAAYRERMVKSGIKQYNFCLNEDEATAVRLFISELRDPASPRHIHVPLFERVNPNSKHYDKALAEKLAQLA